MGRPRKPRLSRGVTFIVGAGLGDSSTANMFREIYGLDKVVDGTVSEVDALVRTGGPRLLAFVAQNDLSSADLDLIASWTISWKIKRVLVTTNARPDARFKSVIVRNTPIEDEGVAHPQK